MFLDQAGEKQGALAYEQDKPRALMRLDPLSEKWELIKDSLPGLSPNAPRVDYIAGADGDQVVLHSSPGQRLLWFAVR
jgi:hypothetical protein